MERRFDPNEPLYTMAALCDIRFKDLVWLTPEQRAASGQQLLEEMMQVQDAVKKQLESQGRGHLLGADDIADDDADGDDCFYKPAAVKVSITNAHCENIQ